MEGDEESNLSFFLNFEDENGTWEIIIGGTNDSDYRENQFDNPCSVSVYNGTSEQKRFYRIVFLTVLQMVPHLKKNTENLVTVMGKKAAAGEAFNVFPYVKCRCLLALMNGRTA